MSAGRLLSEVPKGQHHLEHIHKSKFPKYPARLPHSPRKFVQPDDRLRRWNIRPLDKVRLIVGKPSEKYVDETRGSEGGWKVYTVKSMDMERNRLFLDGISNTRSRQGKPKPENYDQLSLEERQRVDNDNAKVRTARPVHYSNVQLCVEDKNGPDSVFASRLSTSTPYFNKGLRRLEWDRYATKLSGVSDVEPDPERGLVRIPWPVKKLEKAPEPSNLDTSTPTPSPSSLKLSDAEHLVSTMLGPLFPSSARDPIPNSPAARSWVDQHILSPGIPETDTSMPLFLSEELSPRFSRAKRTAGWNQRRELLALERDAAARAAVSAWEAGGRDKSLIDVLGGEDAPGLAGVKLRGRTRAEVREAALMLWDQEQEAKRKEVKAARRAGMKWDPEAEGGAGWVDGEKGLKVERDRRRKALKVQKVARRMEGLVLSEGRNTVLPPSSARV